MTTGFLLGLTREKASLKGVRLMAFIQVKAFDVTGKSVWGAERDGRYPSPKR